MCGLVSVMLGEEKETTMYDIDIRAALRARINRTWQGKPHLLVPEVEVRWDTPVRVDEMLITDKVTGFEIKSDHDSVSRLGRQIRGYNPFVQRAYLVVGGHLKDRAAVLLPPWWGIWEAGLSGKGGTRIRQLRPARRNPEFEAVTLTSYMSRQDVMPILRGMEESGLSSLTLDELRFLLHERLGPAKTAQAAISVMRQREDWVLKSQRAAGTLIPV